MYHSNIKTSKNKFNQCPPSTPTKFSFSSKTTHNVFDYSKHSGFYWLSMLSWRQAQKRKKIHNIKDKYYYEKFWLKNWSVYAISIFHQIEYFMLLKKINFMKCLNKQA